jgi:hypothetical protein
MRSEEDRASPNTALRLPFTTMMCPDEWTFTRGVISHCRVDFTLRFEYGVLAVLPYSLVLIVSALRWYYLWKSGNQSRKLWTQSFLFKGTVVLGAAASSLLSLIAWLNLQHHDEDYKSRIALAAVSLQFLCSVSFSRPSIKLFDRSPSFYYQFGSFLNSGWQSKHQDWCFAPS